MERLVKIVNQYNYFRNISFSRYLLHEIDITFFNAGLIFIPEVFILRKKMGAKESGSGSQGPRILINPLKVLH